MLVTCVEKQHCKKLCNDKSGVSIFCAGCKIDVQHVFC